MKIDIKVIVVKVITWVTMLAVISIGILVALWKNGALEEAVERYKKEHATTKAVIQTTKAAVETGVGTTTKTSATTAKAEVVITNEFIADFTIVNRWKDNYQYGVIIENKTGSKLETWRIEETVPQGCEIYDNWNCNVTIENGKLIVTPMDYNSKIDVGQKITNIGIILTTDKDMFDFQYKEVMSNK